jgi:hypothetical protein
MTVGPGDPFYPPDVPPGSPCAAAHETAVSKYYDMKKAESDAMNAVEKAIAVAVGGVAAAAGGFVLLKVAGGTVAMIAACTATLYQLYDAKAKTDIFKIAAQVWEEADQKLKQCVASNSNENAIEFEAHRP